MITTITNEKTVTDYISDTEYVFTLKELEGAGIFYLKIASDKEQLQMLISEEQLASLGRLINSVTLNAGPPKSSY